MTTRDELAQLIWDTRISPVLDGTDFYIAAADAILARWRLVPVVPSWEDAPPNGYTRGGGLKLPLVPCDTCTAECTCAAQHRAASELTQHDQAAGHYDCELNSDSPLYRD